MNNNNNNNNNRVNVNAPTGTTTIVISKIAPLHPHIYNNNVNLQGAKSKCDKTMVNKRWSAKERKLALLQDVDNLKKKLRHEESVHRALERAFNRPLGALPRLPPFLPQHTLELLAEVAVLEEEVVRLEEQVVSFRKGLYQETVNISSTKMVEDSSESPIKTSKQRHSESLSMNEANLGSLLPKASPAVTKPISSRKLLSDSRVAQHPEKPLKEQAKSGKENHSTLNHDRNKPCLQKKSVDIQNPVRDPALKPESAVKSVDPLKTECRIVEQAQESTSGSSDDRVMDLDSEANKISEDILKCLISIFIRLGSSKGRTMDLESFYALASKSLTENNTESDFRDPYSILSVFKKRDIGNYKNVYAIEANSLDFNRKKNASFLIRRLKILLDKLASVKLNDLGHQQKLAFWINVYNSCIMNAFLEKGIPENPEMIVLQMQKATIKVGGHVLNAMMMEHLILRLPYHLKYTCSKSAKTDESKICRAFGLEWSEPLVTFALSCGGWSSPAVRVYTAAQIEMELETAKRDYLQAAVCISAENKIIIPKLLDWYHRDFAKDLDSFLDWLCLQLPDELRSDTVKCLERKGKEPLSNLVQVMPYSFSFRYLICR